MKRFLEFVAEMLTLVMELEAEYSVSIPMESLGDVKTLADLYEIIK